MTTRVRALSFALAILVMVPVSAAAQSSMTFGVKGGVNSSTLNSKNNPDMKQLLGGVGGVFLGGDVNSTLGIQVEGLFSQRGAKDKSDGFNTNIRLNYIDVPVLARISVGSSNSARFHIFGGMQASYLLKAEASNDDLNLTIDIKDEVETFDFGVTAGAGVEISRLSIDARYTMGLMNVSKDSNEDVKNRTFTVMVGYRLK
jgi:opacity protein-like surface antigen